MSAIPESAVIADGHHIFRRGMRDLLGEAGIEVLAEAADLAALLALLRRERPALVFVDAGLGEAEAIVRLPQRAPEDAHVVFLVEQAISSTMLLCLVEAGAAGCLERNLSPQGFLRSVAALRRGEIALSRGLTQRLCRGLQARAERKRSAASTEKLTPREREVLRYVAQAARNRDIAQALSISEHTVKRHVQNILQKLDVPTRVAAATFFERNEERAEHTAPWALR